VWYNKAMKKKPTQVRVTQVLESAPERVLLRGEVLASGKQVSFHLRRDEAGHVDNLETAVRRGGEPVVELGAGVI